MNQIEYKQEELGLREIITIITNRKRFITIVTILAMLVSVVYGFFIQKPKYEVSSTLMVMTIAPENNEMKLDSSVDSLLAVLSNYPQLTMQTYVEQVKDPYLVKRVFDKLQLGQKSYTIDSLIENVDVEVIGDTNLIRLKLTGADPELISNIINTWSQELVLFVATKTKEQLGRSAFYLQEQMENEQKKVTEAVQALKEYLKEPKGTKELTIEIESRMEQITEFKTKINQLEVDIQSRVSASKQADSLLQRTSETLVTNKTISDDPFLHSVVEQNTKRGSLETGALQMKSEEVNPVYTDLKKEIAKINIEIAQLTAEKKAIEKSLTDNNKVLEELQVLNAEKEAKYSILEEKLKNARETYNQFAHKYEEARITSSAGISETNVSIMSPAFVPEQPVSSNIIRNMIIAGVAGMVLSLLYIFLSYYANPKSTTMSRDIN
ncbi:MULTISPECIES: GumC family protein [unclassified Brevibacillus]|uniref:GumC family protein n=1 Tax=unclassified Brevibacillus TaxID=2684853 RepID=UPI003563176C